MRAERIAYERAWPLRRKVLRPEATVDRDVAYRQELAGDAYTCAVTDGDTVIAIGTVMRDGHPNGSDSNDWRVRGMAVDPDQQGNGLGAVVLDHLLAHASAVGASVVWCNARQAAVGFYERHGFVRRSDLFHAAGGRPHYLMDIDLDAAGNYLGQPGTLDS